MVGYSARRHNLVCGFQRAEPVTGKFVGLHPGEEVVGCARAGCIPGSTGREGTMQPRGHPVPPFPVKSPGIKAAHTPPLGRCQGLPSQPAAPGLWPGFPHWAPHPLPPGFVASPWLQGHPALLSGAWVAIAGSLLRSSQGKAVPLAHVVLLGHKQNKPELCYSFPPSPPRAAVFQMADSFLKTFSIY